MFFTSKQPFVANGSHKAKIIKFKGKSTFCGDFNFVKIFLIGGFLWLFVLVVFLFFFAFFAMVLRGRSRLGKSLVFKLFYLSARL